MNRQEIKTEAKSTIDNLFEQLQRIESQGEDLSDKVKDNFTEKKLALKKQKKDLQHKFEILKDATDKSVDEANKAFNESKKVFKETIDNVTKYFQSA